MGPSRSDGSWATSSSTLTCQSSKASSLYDCRESIAVIRSPLSTGTQTNDFDTLRLSEGGPETKTAAPWATVQTSRSSSLPSKVRAQGDFRTSTGLPVPYASRDGPVTARATGGTTSSTPPTYW